MKDGPRLRIEIHQSAVRAADAAARVKDLKQRLASDQWWTRWDARLRLPFAEARQRKHAEKEDKARRRLRAMAMGV